ncbi:MULTISPECIES: type II toxin-antitoxin system RelB/DinJ family antitoxin [unclassified Enterococcus]|uniref:type II toxin-antitoxin system RelB/DinJ family antitoxin n=1 Tax=unclassified Enterococcus TaxID=2608891 RepID=UPI001A92B812|nr:MULTISPECIES: type II toxin-antitoxin system RelB/DinJ family antitoxin [unclassified Enterococcus]MBO0462591.1 type II toxin-antitoxin system RelB/DinJ family antitoxin [Enterococcus sp. DIV1298c]MBO1300024.1 type II toxin-antitoxin system RelB/DinJ family antitoxin [Enterococcus sp. DIV1271a]
MSTKERLNVNLDSELKKNTAETLETLGLDFTTAINIYFKQIVSKQKIPFEISAQKYFSAEEVMGENWREDLDSVEDEWE